MIQQAIWLYHRISKFGEHLSEFIREFFSPTLAVPRQFASLLQPEDIPSPKSTIRHYDRSGSEFQCRICGEMIALHVIDEHSRLCVVAHQQKYRCMCANDRLREINEEIAAQLLNQGFDVRDATLYPVIFPVLYVYSLGEVAIGVKATDGDAKERLETIRDAMVLFKLPVGVRDEMLLSFLPALDEKILAVSDMSETMGQWRATTRGAASDLGGLDLALCDFEFIRRISSGAFARVYLARKKMTQDLVAVKVIKRSHVNLKNQLRRVTTERDILMRLNSQFMVHFFYSFSEANNLYLIMEYLPGGDLFSLLEHLGSLEEEPVRRYACEIVKALEFLRSSHVVHRDIKPDNFLIDDRGYLHLADFGLSFDGLTNVQRPGRIGTPNYMAPEIVLDERHSFPVDYWSLGVLLFELLCGAAPFQGESEEETFTRILAGDIDWGLLESCSKPCLDFLGRLLQRDPDARIGSSDIQEIMRHEWFAGVDWDHVTDLPPVFVPEPIPPEQANTYFVDRYNFQGNESDIREDIEFARSAVAFRIRSGPGAASQPEFNQVGLAHLMTSNERIAQKMRLSTHMSSVAPPAHLKWSGDLGVYRGSTRSSVFLGEQPRASIPVVQSSGDFRLIANPL
jgi:serine/threonine protein kinase